MWHVDSYWRYNIRRVVAATTEQVSYKQQSNHDDDDSQETIEAEAAAAAAAAAVVVVVRVPSPQTKEPRTTKETEGNVYRKQVKQKHLLLKFEPRHRGGCRADLLLYQVSCMYMWYVVLSAATKAPRALCLISHLPRRF